VKHFFSLVASLSLFFPTGAFATVDFIVKNNFSSDVPNAANYFGDNFSDSQVWLIFLNSGTNVSYYDLALNQTVTVADSAAIQLSTVQSGAFSVAPGANATRVHAALSATGDNPFTGQPEAFSSPYAFALAEFTYLGNVNDITDTSYIDTFAFPTILTTSSGGNTLGSSSWKAGTQAEQVVSALSQSMPSGLGVIQATASSSNPAANRYVGTSLSLQSPVDLSENPNATRTYSGPGYNSYLGYLKTNMPTTTVKDANNDDVTVQGWYLDYSGNGGYSGFLQITGADGEYGLEIVHIRANTGALQGQNTNTDALRNNGTLLLGNIVVAANGDTINFTPTTPPNYTVSGNWTDMVISSGDQIYTNVPAEFGAGPVITGTGDLSPAGSYNDLVATFMATVSASMATGFLGSDYFTFNLHSSTNFAFGPDGQKVDSAFFSDLWSGLPAGEFYWDPFVASLVEFSQWEGYSFPYQDRFSAFPGTALSLNGVDTVTWELGVPIPEPSAFLLLTVAGILFVFRRRQLRDAAGLTFR